MITLGGDAELELVDSLDPFSEGIVFSVPPPLSAPSLSSQPLSSLNPEPSFSRSRPPTLHTGPWTLDPTLTPKSQTPNMPNILPKH